MFVAPKISRQQAENIFAVRKSSFPFIGTLSAGKNPVMPEKMEILYLPFYLFNVLVSSNKKGEKKFQKNQQRVTLSVDGLLGHSVLYATDLTMGGTNPKASAPSCDFEIPSSYASKMALEHYKGILLEHGLRTRSCLSAKEISEGKKIFYPFWIAYFKKKGSYDFKTMDAVSGEIQGAKMRRVFVRALKNLRQRH